MADAAAPRPCPCTDLPARPRVGTFGVKDALWSPIAVARMLHRNGEAQKGRLSCGNLVEPIAHNGHENAAASREQRHERDQWLRDSGVTDWRAGRAVRTA